MIQEYWLFSFDRNQSVKESLMNSNTQMNQIIKFFYFILRWRPDGCMSSLSEYDRYIREERSGKPLMMYCIRNLSWFDVCISTGWLTAANSKSFSVMVTKTFHLAVIHLAFPLLSNKVESSSKADSWGNRCCYAKYWQVDFHSLLTVHVCSVVEFYNYGSTSRSYVEIVQFNVVMRRTVVRAGDWRFDQSIIAY